ncbi:hypothetical protein [Cryobacterium sp. GrIS_2_6]|uniref:hypothetical protein n=1 Tax=Cryobacterium sp. GrIS_2_6 TaxID=3162785 RepID=UPI002E012B97|nr:hypothetical protein [Cryobacterium psychrotolerans]MEC5149278.1 hypothetical protein [Cryobacterium psychrotolerans]MEC5149357.1 hypothetical protein [Cryobacterium psychrotolerans]
MSFTPPNFDPHADSIDVPAYAWSDPEISRLDLMENRQWVRDAVARSLMLPPIVTAPIAPPRKSHSALAWATTALLLAVLGLLVLAVAISQ